MSDTTYADIEDFDYSVANPTVGTALVQTSLFDDEQGARRLQGYYLNPEAWRSVVNAFVGEGSPLVATESSVGGAFERFTAAVQGFVAAPVA